MEKHYENEEIKITWKPSICIHSAVCFKQLSSVFDPRRKPWIILENNSTEEIKNTIDKCPSGALSYELKKEITIENKSDKSAIIQVMKSGPLIIKNGCVIEDENGQQIIKEGTVALCRCGASTTKPFCDGSHRKMAL